MSFALTIAFDFGNGPIEYGDTVSMVVHVQDQVLTHDGQTDERDVTTLLFHKNS